MILRGALKASSQMTPLIYSLLGEPIQNKENDLDFQLPTSSGTQYMDLAEIAVGMDKGGYTGAPHKHSVGDLVDSVWSVIQAKEKKYGERRKIAVHLLLYSVDWRFLLSESCIALLKRYCVRRKQHFVSIAYYAPITLHEGILWPLFPVDETSLPVMDEAAVRSNILKQGNPQAFVATPEGMGAQLQFPE